MKRFMSVTLALLLAAMAGGGMLPPASPAWAAGVQVSVNAPTNVLPGSDFTATVSISEVVALNGAQYEVVVNPSVLVVDNVTAGQIGATVMPVQGFTQISPGRYLVLQSLMFDTVNGTGNLAVVHFRVVGFPGDNSTINLANGILSGWTGEILADWVGDSVNVPVMEVQLVSLAVTPANPSVALGLTQQFTATGIYSDNSTADLTATATWTSSNTAVATISATGLASAVGAGTTIITATSGAISGSTTLTAVSTTGLTQIIVTPNAVSIILGQSQQFFALGYYAGAPSTDLTGAVNWTSSNTSVATISGTGLFTAVAVGTTTIGATFAGVTGSTALTVTLSLSSATRVEVNNGSTVTLSPGQVITGSLTAGIPIDVKNIITTAQGLAAFDFTLNWNPAVIQVDRVRTSLAAIDQGWSFTVGAITSNVTTGIGKVQFVGTTTQQPYSKADITLAYLGITTVGNRGYNTTLAVVINDLVDNAIKEIIPRGAVNAAVMIPELVSIAVTPVNPSIALGLTQQFTATGTYSDNSTADLTATATWASSNAGVATISAAGLATSVTQGTTNITATSGGISGSTTLTVMIPSHVAETSIAQGLSTNATGVVVVKVNIDRIKNPADNSTTTIPGGIGSYSAMVSGSPSNAIQILNVYGVPPFDNPTFDNVTGVFSVANVTSPIQPNNTTVAEVVAILTGDTTTDVTLNVAFQAIGAAGQPEMNVPEEHSNTIPLRRGDVSKDGHTTIVDTLAIEQYLVGNLTLGDLNPLNAASVKHDGAGGDKIDMVDALFIVQYLVAQRTAYFESPPAQDIPAVGTTVEVNSGNIVTINQGETITASGTGGIPMAVKNLPNLVQGNGLAAFDLTITFNPNVIKVDKLVLSSVALEGNFALMRNIDNVTGRVRFVGFTYGGDTGYSTADITLLYLGITAVGSGSTSINVSITTLVDKDGNPIPATPVNATVSVLSALVSLDITPMAPSIVAGQTQQFTATGTYTDNATANITGSVTWASSNIAVATISAAGLATSVAQGTTTITATSGAISGTTTLTVTAPVLVSIAVTPAAATIGLGQTQQFTATGIYSDNSTVNLTATATWASSNTAVATISATGLATSVAQGTTTITATSGAISGSTTLTVTAPVLLSVAVTPANPSVAQGLKQQFTATGTYGDNSIADLTATATWASSNTGVATVSAAGLATSVTQGTTNITATSGAISGSTTVTVTAPVLLSIAVAPAAATIGLGQTQQFTATGTYTSGPSDITTTVTWASSNASVATVSAAGLATGVAAGTTVITAAFDSVTSPGATLTVARGTTVEVNLGNKISLGPGQVITGSSSAGVPIDVKNIVTAAEGLAAFDFTLNWNPAVIRVDTVKTSLAALLQGWGFTIGAINNTAGTVGFVGTTTMQPYSKLDITLAYLGITAVGNLGDNTTITITVKDLVDNALQQITPRSAVNAPVEVVMSLRAETSIAQAKDAVGVVVVKVNIDRIKNPTDNSTATIPGGIGSYTATASGNVSDSIQFLAVQGVSPFDNPTFDNVTGIFSVATVSNPPQASNTTVANVVPILTGNTTTSLTLIISFQVIGAAGQPGLNVPEEHSNTITLLRGDTDNSGKITITDSLALKQYLVGQLVLSQINPINAATPNHDGAGGDKITVTDALAIEQYLVKQLNAYFK